MSIDTLLLDSKDAGDVDGRLLDILHLLGNAPLERISEILDIGAGQGQIAKYLSRMGKKVTCTGVNIASYIDDVDNLRQRYGIDYVECNIEAMPFPDASFDAVIMSHVLEHCPNVSLALSMARRVLRAEGVLIIIVPPQENIVCGGHVSMGWSIGQLMYVLVLNGYDIHTGSFIEFGYNVCGIVKRTERVLPLLRGDSGDVATLARHGFFPAAIGLEDHFNGCFKAVNWPSIDRYQVPAKRGRLQSILLLLIERLPFSKFKFQVGNFLMRFGRVLLRHSIANPKQLP